MSGAEPPGREHSRMNRMELTASPRRSPLELFLRDYVAAREGEWDEIEPQVYDVMMESDLLRVTFDPEALPEHPQAQLATYGSPLIDRLLSDAAGRWNSAIFYRTGLHLAPYNLEARVSRAIRLPAGAGIELQRKRAMHFPQAIFWFRATFASDQKEDEVLPIGIDLFRLREVRNLDGLLDFGRLSSEPESPLAEAPHPGLLAAWRIARVHAARSFAPLANARRREWSGAVQKQIQRMRAYYARLRDEAAQPPARLRDPQAAAARAQARAESIDREERLRIAELQRKSELRAQVKLTNLLVVHQPKLMLAAAIVPKSGAASPLQLVWDPLSDSVEAASCPSCGQPTFELDISRRGLKCPGCHSRS
jgi:hypothetical protein